VREPGILYDAKKRDKNLVAVLDPNSFEAEQFKMLRSRILFPVSGTPPKSILVTSALPGEGKSFVAANLAISIAMEINKYVLLMDCDLRKPDLHHQFGFDRVSGLSDYLADQRELSSLLLQTGIEKLTLLPGGAQASNPSELMSSNRMAELLDEVKYRYHDRLIVIDSPPIGLSAETSVLARQADGTLVVTKYGKTPKAKVADILETVGSHKILGCILNQMDKRVARYYGYKKYGKYGGRPYGQ
jgi:exopolysaccharide/PEP-CTERM locus tyrosine autokinase